MARRAEKFDERQKQIFLEEFPRYLAHYYLTRVDEFENEELDPKIGSQQISPTRIMVSTTIVGGRYRKMKINYQLRERPDRWVVEDVEIDGVSVVENFKAQCRSVIERQGVEELLKKLHEKIESDTPGELDEAVVG